MSDGPAAPHASPHLTEDTIELYSLGRLDEQGTAAVEEHLLLCAACQDRVLEADRYVNTMRSALKEVREPQRRPMFDMRWAAALAVAGLASLAIVPTLRRSAAEPQEVALEVFRGGEGGGAVAQAGRPLVVRMDTAGIDASELQVEIVNAGGAAVWKGRTTASGGSATVATGKTLSGGQYWVRFVNAQDGKLLREFSLQVK